MVFMTQSSVPLSHGTGEDGASGARTLATCGGGYPEEFRVQLEEAITGCRSTGRQSALMLLCIDNLAMIMSGYGSIVSEDVCLALMQTVTRALTPDDLVARLHKDQFGIILADAPRDHLPAMTVRLREAIQQFCYQSAYGSLHVLPVIACVELGGERLQADEALDRAFIALRNHQSIVHDNFEENPQDAANSRQEMGLANYLGRAIREQRLRLAYQPIIESKTGRVAHYEALLRIVGHDGKISSAGTLIPIAERMGLINVIDELVLNMVIEELARAPKLELAFNVSNLTTNNRHWLDLLKQKLKDHPGVAERLTVEITETAVHRDLKKTAYFVAAVQSLGAQVALDDFGSGYTSFRQLKSLSVDMVKIDGVFVRDLVDNNDNRLFVKTMLDFTNGFGLKAVAEFVETGEIAKMLMELGVEYMQGYYFGKPENHRSWLNEDPVP